MSIRIKEKLLGIADKIVGIFYPRRRPRDFSWAKIKKIIVIRPDRIGDVILSLPALRELKKKRPDINLTMLVSTYTQELLEGSKIIDSVIVLEQSMGFREWVRFIKTLRRVKYDLAIDMMFSRKIFSGFLTFLTNAGVKLGFDAGVKRLFFNCRLSPQDGEKYEVERNFELLKYLVGPNVDVSLDSDCIMPDPAYVNSLFRNEMSRDGSRLRVGIHPGAYRNVANRLWPKERYAELADRIISSYKGTVFFTGSKGEEDRQLLESIEQSMRNKAVFIKGEATLRQLYALCQVLDVFISTFTGPLHLAASAGVSTVVLGGPTPVRRWMPRDKSHILIQADIDCVPCRDSSVCFRKDYACMRNITVEDVFDAVERVITKRGKPKRS